MPHVNKKFRSLRENFFTRQFLALSKTAVWTKTTLFSLHSSLLFSSKITPNFFTRFISRFKNHSTKIDLKKELLQYSSSSRKKTQRPNTIQFLWIVKNHDVPNNSRYRFAAINKQTTGRRIAHEKPKKIEKLQKIKKNSSNFSPFLSYFKKHFQKTWKKLQKLVSFRVFVFVVPKYIAHKIVIKSKFVSKKAFFNF